MDMPVLIVIDDRLPHRVPRADRSEFIVIESITIASQSNCESSESSVLGDRKTAQLELDGELLRGPNDPVSMLQQLEVERALGLGHAHTVLDRHHLPRRHLHRLEVLGAHRSSTDRSHLAVLGLLLLAGLGLGLQPDPQGLLPGRLCLPPLLRQEVLPRLVELGLLPLALLLLKLRPRLELPLLLLLELLDQPVLTIEDGVLVIERLGASTASPVDWRGGEGASDYLGWETTLSMPSLFHQYTCESHLAAMRS